MLVDEFYESATWKTTNARFSNVVGTMLDVTTLLEDVPYFEAGIIPDTYTFVASASSGSGATRQCTLTITTASKNNPVNGKVATNVIVGTPYDDSWYDLIPGVVQLYFDGTANDGDTFIVSIGRFQGTFEAGGVTAGVGSTGTRHKVTNNGTVDVVQCKARVLPQITYMVKTGHVLYSAKNFAEGATEKLDPLTGQLLPYVMSISGVTGTGSTRTCNILLDGVLFPAGSLKDLTANTVVSGTGIKCPHVASDADVRPYKVLTGPLMGMEFAISEQSVNGDFMNIIVSGAKYAQLAPDLTGTEGEYGTADVDLTESGQTVGTITPSGVAYYWSRILVPEGSSGLGNPALVSICLEGNESEPGSANWLG